jgi:hypothetical protein
MGGGLMQLVAYGSQDIYLTGNPQITFFKVVYRRHTNFSMECVDQTLSGTQLAAESNLVSTISRNGDLISNMHLDVKLPAHITTISDDATYINWTNNTGHAFLKSVEIEIGGQLIDKQYGHWLDVWNELTDHNKFERTLINKHSDKNAYLKKNLSKTLPELQLYIPLKFWFNRNPGLALPLIALQYHEVKIKYTTRALDKLVTTDGTGGNIGAFTSNPSCKLWVDYIYLDTEERRRFAQVSHEYLIEQLQYSNDSIASEIGLNLNHTVKEIIWTVQNTTVVSESNTVGNININDNKQGGKLTHRNDYFNYSGNDTNALLTEVINGDISYEGFGTCELKLNGQSRFTKRKASYFRTLQPVQSGHACPEKHIYSYSFALKPEEHQPSGTCNFSRIDSAALKFVSVQSNSNINVYAINYNVLRVMSGMGGLAYSN